MSIWHAIFGKPETPEQRQERTKQLMEQRAAHEAALDRQFPYRRLQRIEINLRRFHDEENPALRRRYNNLGAILDGLYGQGSSVDQSTIDLLQKGVEELYDAYDKERQRRLASELHNLKARLNGGAA